MTNVITLPVPGAVKPAPGVGLTLHHNAGLVPGTILRAGPRIFWFQIDNGFPGAERLTEVQLGWTYRAVLQPDGAWREEPDMRRVDVGVRRARLASPADFGVPGRRTADQLAAAVERLAPWFLKRHWYPMTLMAMPTVLISADELLGEIEAYEGPASDRVGSLHERLAALRARFRNVGSG